MNEGREIRELVCISCPVGCRLEALRKDDGSLEVTGNQCPKGEDYAREEINAPKRIVTTTVALALPDTGGNEGKSARERVPVRTDAPLPVEHIGPLLAKLHGMKLHPPVRRGDVVIENVAGTGVKVVASMTVE